MKTSPTEHKAIDRVFGFVKGHFTEVPKTKSALQTALVGSLAVGVAYAIAKFIP